MLTAFPDARKELIDDAAEWQMKMIIDLVSRVRNLRSEMNIKPGERITVLVGAADTHIRDLFSATRDQITRLVRASELSITAELNAPKASARAVLAGGAEVAIPLEGLIDFAQERVRLLRELEKLQAEAAKIEAQLTNPNFVQRAPAEKVNELRTRIADISQRSEQLRQTVENLQ